MFGFFKKLVTGQSAESPAGHLGPDELAKRLGLDASLLSAVPLNYQTFEIPKRSGGTRTIAAPNPDLKKLQRRILRRVLAKLKTHPAATGFEPGHSIVSNAMPHAGQDVVIRLDLKDFFPHTSAKKADAYFRKIGWNAEAAALLTKLCTHDYALPQGAPTSPRLSNLVNHKLDARLSALAAARGLAYSRYADDITFSGPEKSKVAKYESRINDVIHVVKKIVKEEGYALHTERKLRLYRKHDRQIVTGLVVNQKPNLKRETRRWLRAVEHHLKTGKPATLTPEQLRGWQSLQSMIAVQSEPS